MMEWLYSDFRDGMILYQYLVEGMKRFYFCLVGGME